MAMGSNLNDNDFSEISKKGINKEKVLNQIAQFARGFPFARLSAAAALSNGIVDIASQKEELIRAYDQSELSTMKFVPASGAATRMFKKLFEFRSESKKKDEAYSKMVKEKGAIYNFFNELESFAFYQDLKKTFKESKGYTLEEARKKQDFNDILDMLLNKEGLNYGELPKGLLKFHRYKGFAKTPTEEHLTEGEQYANKKNKVNIHFTVSPEHQHAFEFHVKDAVNKRSVQFDINFSTQKPSTDTIAVNMDNTPFRTDNGDLLFRPAGHGALLENLNELDTDIVFIKNIDNVVPDRIKAETVEYKKALAGLLINYQSKSFSLLRKHDGGVNIESEGKSLLEEMGIKGDLTPQHVVEKLNRPIRVCGMVQNEGEPGGGPFWINNNDGTTSLQIVESAQVDMSDKSQVTIFKDSTHFNPVDLVCGIKNYRGEKFDLLKYRDPNAGFISEKSNSGRKLKAMELPGLWNGAMADWNTIFVEVPLITFNPVKTVNDLLKENHR